MADPVTRAFARSMLRLRTKRGWSQRRLAGESGVSRHTIEKAESRAAGPGLAVARAIAAALDTTIDAMIAEDDLEAAVTGLLPEAEAPR